MYVYRYIYLCVCVYLEKYKGIIGLYGFRVFSLRISGIRAMRVYTLNMDLTKKGDQS